MKTPQRIARSLRSRKSLRLLTFVVLGALIAVGCSSSDPIADADSSDASDSSEGTDSESESSTPLPIPEVERGVEIDFGTPPPIPDGPLSPEIVAALDSVFLTGFDDGLLLLEEVDAVQTLGDSEDPRIAWLFVDLIRFLREPEMLVLFSAGASELLGVEFDAVNAWSTATDHLIAWDVPAPPNYLEYKRAIFTLVEPAWEELMVEGDIDWRHVSWGGVLIDDRPYDTTDDQCNCIPAIDNPVVTTAEQAEWLEDSDTVFGVEINGETRAYPRQIMEVREMVNDTLGGRNFAMPYCTLCGAAQVYLTDELADGIDRPIMRTSGLLIRSNKVMYDVTSGTVFDTFRGNAVAGPLQEEGVVLDQVTVITATWGDWKEANPDTTVLIEADALGRDFDFRNGRDADGPIFPIGDVDPRLPVQEDVFGVLVDGQAIGFHVETAIAILRNGGEVSLNGVNLGLAGGGVRAFDDAGESLAGHQAFWFAWSQFHPDTLLWTA